MRAHRSSFVTPLTYIGVGVFAVTLYASLNMVGPALTGDTCQLTEDTKAQAWETWDSQEGWTHLKVDPSQPIRVDVTACSYVPLTADNGELVLVDSTVTYYLFTAGQ